MFLTAARVILRTPQTLAVPSAVSSFRPIARNRKENDFSDAQYCQLRACQYGFSSLAL
jgi:hypothetical protein